jgi:hypothetical protein
VVGRLSTRPDNNKKVVGGEDGDGIYVKLTRLCKIDKTGRESSDAKVGCGNGSKFCGQMR